MKNIITAIGEPTLNKKLKLEENINVLENDIQYQEGIFESLEKENNIDFLIISEKIEGDLNIVQLIQKIKLMNQKIKIIIILENKKEELENILIAKGIYKIIYHNQIEIKDMIYLIKNPEINQNNKKLNEENEKLKQEIENLKKRMIYNNEINDNNSDYNENRNKDNKSNNKNNEKNNEKNNLEKGNKIDTKTMNEKIQNMKLKIIQKNKLFQEINKIKTNTKKVKKAEIISVSGPSGAGKSIITVNLAKSLSYQKQKILIVDFDILNYSLHTILGVKKYPETQEIKENYFVIKINKRIDLISATDILFGTKEKIDFIKIEKVLNELKEKYDTIIIDTSSECFFDFTKTVIKLSNKNIFVTEANILEIKKAKQLLNIYIHNWKINKNKFNILFNKYDKECIDINLLKNIFCEFNIIGVLKYHSKYNKLINKNIKNNFVDKTIRNEYLTLNQKI